MKPACRFFKLDAQLISCVKKFINTNSQFIFYKNIFFISFLLIYKKIEINRYLIFFFTILFFVFFLWKLFNFVTYFMKFILILYKYFMHQTNEINNLFLHSIITGCMICCEHYILFFFFCFLNCAGWFQ